MSSPVIVDVTKESDTRAAFELHGLSRVEVEESPDREAVYPIVRARLVHDPDDEPAQTARDALVQSIRASLEQLSDQGYVIAGDAVEQELGLQKPGIVADMVGAIALHSPREHLTLLDEFSVDRRLERVDRALAELLRESDAHYPTSRDIMN